MSIIKLELVYLILVWKLWRWSFCRHGIENMWRWSAQEHYRWHTRVYHVQSWGSSERDKYCI